MRITSHLFEAFLKCATKCHLRSLGETGSGNEYAEWVRVQDESYQREAARRLQEAVPETERVVAPPATENLKAAKWRLAEDLVAQTSHRSADSLVREPQPNEETRGLGGPHHESRSSGRESAPSISHESQSRLTSAATVQGFNAQTVSDNSHSEQRLESCLHAVERVPSEGRGKPAQFVPIHFVFRNKLTKDDRLLLAFDALVLSQVLERAVSLGKIIHGDDHACLRGARKQATLKVKTSALAGEVRKRIEKITALLSSPAPPDLVLNRHCAECEFQARCRKIAVEKDDLSLLARMSAKERQKLRSKGIFTVTQLSYTFRPRRRPKKLRDKREKYHHSLKALAIREKKIHIVGTPELKIEGTPVYLDVEGLPDRDFYYLIGLRIGSGESAVQHSLWADTVENEGKIWREFLAILETIEKPVLIHYGSYETIFLERMCELHCGPAEGSQIATTIRTAVNVVSVLFAQIYFPTYANGLKDIGERLGFKWSEAEPSGLKTVIWRFAWEGTNAPHLREKLITYNVEDCQALEMLVRAILKSGTSQSADEPMESWAANVVHTESIPRETMWGKFSTPISEFEQINKAARWDYQRDRVLIRSSKRIRRIAVQKRKAKNPESVSTVIPYPEKAFCPVCGQPGRRHAIPTERVLHDLHIGRASLRRRNVEYHYRVFWCSGCRLRYGVPQEFWPRSKYGRNLAAYLLYHIIKLYVPMYVVAESLNRFLGFGLTQPIVHNLKRSAARHYGETQMKILEHLIKGSLLHVDETRVSIRGETAYVWVFTNLHDVAYLYADTREGEFVQTLLKDFRGVLVSDFYAAYDSIECPQQKCLLHLMRDLNAEILKQPYDEELKLIVRGFADLLKPMVETVDRFGLKMHFLRKHLVLVKRFYQRLNRMACQSEVAVKCKQRFEKNKNKLFTFLEYDGVPWNNNNAEHAIKAFARLRQLIQGTCTAEAVQEYLVLLSVCETCEYTGVDFLDFLRSGEKDIHAFAESRRGRRRRSPTSEPKALPPDALAEK